MPLDQKPKKFGDDWRKYGNLGAEFVASVLIGTLGGYGLDYLLHTKPWIMIVGFIFGAAAGFRSLFRLLGKEEEERKKE